MAITNKEPVVFNPPEKSRTYFFPTCWGLFNFKLENVTELIVSDSGNHRLKTADGKSHIVPPGWIHVELEIEKWTV